MMVLGNMCFRQRTEVLIGLGFIAAGAAVYWLILRPRAPAGGTRLQPVEAPPAA